MAKKLSSRAKALYIIFALALTFSMVPALTLSVATPVGAVNGNPSVDSFEAYCYPQGGPLNFNNLYGVVRFEIDANSNEAVSDMKYLEIDIWACCPDNCAQDECDSGTPLQLVFAANPGDIFRDSMHYPLPGTAWSPDMKELAAEMGLDMVNSSYNAATETWNIILDVTKLWTPRGVELANLLLCVPWMHGVNVGSPVWPKCCEHWINDVGDNTCNDWDIYIEVGDTEDLQGGDLSTCLDTGPGDADGIYHKNVEFMGMHLKWPSEVDPRCGKPGESVQVCWNFHADCQPVEIFEVLIYQPGPPVVIASGPKDITEGDLTISQCYEGCVMMPILPGTPDGVYNVKITSLCCDEPLDLCVKRVEEVDAVIIDSTPPVVDVTDADLTWNYEDSDTIRLEWTMSDETKLSKVKIEFSKDSGSTWGAAPIFYGPYTDAKIHRVGTTDDYWTEIHVGSDNNGDDFALGEALLEACHLAHLKVTAEDWCQNSASGETGAFTIDNTAPTVSGLSAGPLFPNMLCDPFDCLKGCTMSYIEFDYSDNCGPLTAKIEYDVGNSGSWTTIVSGLALPDQVANGAWAYTDYQYPWHVPPTIDDCDVDIKVTVTDCPGKTAYTEHETCAVAPLMMVDAITGWCWHWAHYCDRPMNCNARDTIMVVFNKELDLDTVTIADFQVVGKTITGMEIHHGTDVKCFDSVWDGYTLVFLTVAPIMATDATPTVKLVGCVSTPADGSEELCGPEELEAQDGIAPIISLTADGDPTTYGDQEPAYNQMVTVTATASEPLKEAYLQVFSGIPDNYNWDSEKPIGWPVDHDTPHDVPASTWVSDGWLEMEPKLISAGPPEVYDYTVWTVEFRNMFGPTDPWFIEVAAHDFSHWLPEYPWKHEKWTEESIKFHAVDYIKIELCEGWNLISMPRDLTDPSVGAVLPGSAVTKVYYYTGGQYGYWQSAFLNPLTWTWTGTITSIEPGKAYWVWCSPPWFDLRLYFVDPDPLAVPPSYALAKGWNMVGFHDFDPGGRRGGCEDMAAYFASILTSELQAILWSYDACDQDWDGTPLCVSCCEEDGRGRKGGKCCDTKVCPGQGYWLALPEARTLYPGESSESGGRR